MSFVKLTLVLGVVAVAALGAYLLLRDDPSSAVTTQPTSTSLPSSTFEWTQEEMDKAKAPDTTVGPDATELALGAAGLVAAITAGIVIMVRRRR